MRNAKTIVGLFLIVLVLPALAEDDEPHRVKDLKVTILSTMMTEIGIIVDRTGITRVTTNGWLSSRPGMTQPISSV